VLLEVLGYTCQASRKGLLDVSDGYVSSDVTIGEEGRPCQRVTSRIYKGPWVRIVKLSFAGFNEVRQ